MNTAPCTCAWSPSARTLHVVDIENLCGADHLSASAITSAGIASQLVMAPKPGDHIWVACNPGIAMAAHEGLPSARLLVRGGTNGADLALLEALAEGDVTQRYGQLVLASGDGIFASMLATLRLRGLRVVVVARAGSLSMRLRRVAHAVRLLPPVGWPDAMEARAAA